MYSISYIMMNFGIVDVGNKGDYTSLVLNGRFNIDLFSIHLRRSVVVVRCDDKFKSYLVSVDFPNNLVWNDEVGRL